MFTHSLHDGNSPWKWQTRTQVAKVHIIKTPGLNSSSMNFKKYLATGLSQMQIFSI